MAYQLWSGTPTQVLLTGVDAGKQDGVRDRSCLDGAAPEAGLAQPSASPPLLLPRQWLAFGDRCQRNDNNWTMLTMGEVRRN
jgi:hypothetical protein